MNYILISQKNGKLMDIKKFRSGNIILRVAIERDSSKVSFQAWHQDAAYAPELVYVESENRFVIEFSGLGMHTPESINRVIQNINDVAAFCSKFRSESFCY